MVCYMENLDSKSKLSFSFWVEKTLTIAFFVLLFTNSVSTDPHNLLGWVKLPEQQLQIAAHFPKCFGTECTIDKLGLHEGYLV